MSRAAGHAAQLLLGGLVLLASSALLTACGTGLARGPAQKDADGAAERAGNVMVNRHDLTPGQRIGLVTGHNEIRTIDALQADGSPNGVVILRISSTIDQGEFNAKDTATRCYRYAIEGGYLSPDPHQIDCPDRPVVAPSVIPPDEFIPGDSQARAKAAVASLPVAEQLDATAVAAALKHAFSEETVRIDTTLRAGALGLSVAAGKSSCLFGRVTPGASGGKASFESWIVPKVLAQPGELGCAAQFAAVGDGKNPPH